MNHDSGSRGWRVARHGASHLRVIRVPDAASATEMVLALVIETLGSSAEPSFGLATGGTFQEFFRRVVQLENAGRLDLRHATFTHLDEYVGLGPESAGGMVHELNEVLFGKLRRGVKRFSPAPATAADPAAAQAELLDTHPGIDLQLLGIGRNGHVAFNEPGTPFHHRTHVTDLAADTIDANAARFPDGNHPRQALTMGPAAILETRRAVLVATGAGKADAVRAMLEDPVSPACPASIMRLHPDATIIIDDAAAAALTDECGSTPRRLPTSVLRADDLDPGGAVAVISPHPDDASISCGGLLASLPSSVPRHIVTMTTGARARVPGGGTAEEVTELREAEVREEAAALECDTTFLRCRFYDSGVFENGDVDALVATLAEIDPAWVLAPAREDPHPTHRMTRLVLDEALLRHERMTGRPVEVWTFEGAWHQHANEDVNALVVFDEEAERRKLAAVRAHASQLARVPFDEGAIALARLRAVTFSETHFGGTEVGALDSLPLVEAYVRESR